MLRGVGREWEVADNRGACNWMAFLPSDFFRSLICPVSCVLEDGMPEAEGEGYFTLVADRVLELLFGLRVACFCFGVGRFMQQRYNPSITKSKDIT